jgi:HYR domain-containing protein
VPDVIAGVIANDLCTPPELLTVTQNPAAGTLVGKGVNTITITVKDESNNTATCTTTFTVTDSIPPTITCPANLVVYLPPNSTATSMAVNYTVSATDNCSGVTVESSPSSGSVFTVGSTIVNATATDSSNNTSTCSFTVTVRFDFTGFLSPVGNLPTLNVVNANRAVPVKFSLSGDKGLNIFAAGFPSSGTIACDATAPPVDVTETVTAGSSTLSYDSVSDQYIYVWKAENQWAGTCRQLILKLKDGTTHVANFKIR